MIVMLGNSGMVKDGPSELKEIGVLDVPDATVVTVSTMSW